MRDAEYLPVLCTAIVGDLGFAQDHFEPFLYAVLDAIEHSLQLLRR